MLPYFQNFMYIYKYSREIITWLTFCPKYLACILLVIFCKSLFIYTLSCPRTQKKRNLILQGHINFEYRCSFSCVSLSLFLFMCQFIIVPFHVSVYHCSFTCVSYHWSFSCVSLSLFLFMCQFIIFPFHVSVYHCSFSCVSLSMFLFMCQFIRCSFYFSFPFKNARASYDFSSNDPFPYPRYTDDWFNR